MWIILAFLLVSLLPFPFLARIAFDAYEKKISDTYMSVMQGEGHLLREFIHTAFGACRGRGQVCGQGHRHSSVQPASSCTLLRALRM